MSEWVSGCFNWWVIYCNNEWVSKLVWVDIWVWLSGWVSRWDSMWGCWMSNGVNRWGHGRVDIVSLWMGGWVMEFKFVCKWVEQWEWRKNKDEWEGGWLLQLGSEWAAIVLHQICYHCGCIWVYELNAPNWVMFLFLISHYLSISAICTGIHNSW